MIYALVRIPAVHPWSNLICMWGMHSFTKYYVWLLFSLGSKFYYINFQDNCLECLSSFLWTDTRFRNYLEIGDLLPVSDFVLWLISYTVLFFNVAVKKSYLLRGHVCYLFMGVGPSQNTTLKSWGKMSLNVVEICSVKPHCVICSVINSCGVVPFNIKMGNCTENTMEFCWYFKSMFSSQKGR